MKRILLTLPLLTACESAPTASLASAWNESIACPATVADPQVPAQVTGTAHRADYPLSNTIDGVLNTFMTTTTVTVGTTKTILYKFPSQVNLARVDMVNNYSNTYAMGDLTVSVSQDSTDGSDGLWVDVASMTAATTNFTGGDGSIQISKNCVRWLKLSMTYTGTGAFGGSPAFYLSEAWFYSN